MNRRMALCLLCLLLLFPLSCGKKPETGDNTVLVWYLRPELGQNGGELLRAEKRVVPAGGGRIETAFAALGGEPQDSALARAVPESVSLLSWSLRGQALRVDLSGGYAALEGAVLSAARAAMALTFCGIQGVESVSFYVDGEAVDTELRAEEILLANTGLNPYNKWIKLYFADLETGGLAFETRSIRLGEGEELVQAVMRELFRGPVSEGLGQTLPEDAGLLGARMESRVCVVDLDAAFLDGPSPETAAAAIANTLTTLTGVFSVQILINGRRVSRFYDPIEFSEAPAPARTAG